PAGCHHLVQPSDRGIVLGAGARRAGPADWRGRKAANTPHQRLPPARAAAGAVPKHYCYRKIARGALELAAAYDRPDQDRLLSVAALFAVAEGVVEDAEAYLAKVGRADGLFPRLARAAITEHGHEEGAGEDSELNRVVQEADPAELAGEPPLLNVLA